MKYVILAVLGALAWALTILVAPEVGKRVYRLLVSGGDRAQLVMAGVAGGAILLLVLRVFLRHAVEFWMTLDHEATHALASVLTGGRPVSLHVDHQGGQVNHVGSRVKWFVSLAPYCVPITTMALLLLGVLLPRPWPLPFVTLVAITLGYHLASDALEARPHQPDISHTGGWLALASIAGFWGVTLTTMVGFLALGAAPTAKILRAAWRQAFAVVS